MPTIASSARPQRPPRRTGQPRCGDRVFYVARVEYLCTGDPVRLGAKVSVGSERALESWYDVTRCISMLVDEARREEESRRFTSQGDRKTEEVYWLAGIRVHCYTIGADTGTPAEFLYDAVGQFVDGTEPPPDLQDAPFPNASRDFAIGEVVGAVFAQRFLPGVVRAQRAFVDHAGRAQIELDIQTAIDRGDGEPHRAWVHRKDVAPLRRDEVPEHHLYWLAAELLDEAELAAATARLRHVGPEVRPERPMELPKLVQRALLHDIDEPVFYLELERMVLKALPGGRHDVVREKLGVFRSRTEVLAAVSRFAGADEYRNWKLDHGGPQPTRLVLQYIVTCETFSHLPQDDPAAQEQAQDGAEPFVFLSPDRVRIAEPANYSWRFDRLGRCLGMEDFSDLLLIPTPRQDLALKVGDIVAYPHDPLTPAVVVALPPEHTMIGKIPLEMNDNGYTLERGNVIVGHWADVSDNTHEAPILLYEQALDERARRRLARLLQISELEPSVRRLRFHGEA